MIQKKDFPVIRHLSPKVLTLETPSINTSFHNLRDHQLLFKNISLNLSFLPPLYFRNGFLLSSLLFHICIVPVSFHHFSLGINIESLHLVNTDINLLDLLMRHCYKYVSIITHNKVVHVCRGAVLCRRLGESAILQTVRDSPISHRTDSGDAADGTYITRAQSAISHSTRNEIAHSMIHAIH